MEKSCRDPATWDPRTPHSRCNSRILDPPSHVMYIIQSICCRVDREKQVTRVKWTVKRNLYFVLTLFCLPIRHVLLEIKNGNTRKRCEISSKLTIETLELRHWCSSDSFIANFKHISHLSLAFLLLSKAWCCY